MINAGVHSALPMGFGKMTPEAWARGIDLNLNAHYQLVHKFLPVFEAQEKGHFIHFTTIASSVGLGIGNQRHAYAAGKSGAATLTKRIGVEYAKKGIRGNVVGIGYVTGPLVNRAVAQAIAGGANTSIEKVTAVRDSYVPRGSQILPEEVANTAAFLASDLSSAINGTEIYADGGSSGWQQRLHLRPVSVGAPGASPKALAYAYDGMGRDRPADARHTTTRHTATAVRAAGRVGIWSARCVSRCVSECVAACRPGIDWPGVRRD